MERFPTIRLLAAATPDEVNVLWAGLGYYRRAAQILACAKLLVAEHGGDLPETTEELLKLPGIGEHFEMR
jgi:A/G-specific adenine glycosylase